MTNSLRLSLFGALFLSVLALSTACGRDAPLEPTDPAAAWIAHGFEPATAEWTKSRLAPAFGPALPRDKIDRLRHHVDCALIVLSEDDVEIASGFVACGLAAILADWRIRLDCISTYAVRLSVANSGTEVNAGLIPTSAFASAENADVPRRIAERTPKGVRRSADKWARPILRVYVFDRPDDEQTDSAFARGFSGAECADDDPLAWTIWLSLPSAKRVSSSDVSSLLQGNHRRLRQPLVALTNATARTLTGNPELEIGAAAFRDWWRGKARLMDAKQRAIARRARPVIERTKNVPVLEFTK